MLWFGIFREVGRNLSDGNYILRLWRVCFSLLCWVQICYAMLGMHSISARNAH